jgi:hypothetical protein
MKLHTLLFALLLLGHVRAADPIGLQMKFTPGQMLRYRMDMNQQSDMKVGEQPMQQQMTMSQEFSFSVVKERPEGGWEMEMQFHSMKLDMKMNGNAVLAYDSANPPPPESADPVAKGMANLTKGKLKYFIAKDGKVEKVEGLERLLALTGPGAPTLKGVINEDFLEQLSFTYILPKKPVREGDTWKARLEVPAGPLGTIASDLDVRLKAVEEREGHRVAVLAADGTLTSSRDEAEPGAAQPPLKIDLTGGTQKSEMAWDIELGQFRGSHIEQTLRFNMDGPNPSGGADRMKVGVTAVQTMDLKLIEVGSVPAAAK